FHWPLICRNLIISNGIPGANSTFALEMRGYQLLALPLFYFGKDRGFALHSSLRIFKEESDDCMYQMDQLLNLLTAEKARVLQFRAGSPPIMLSERERHLLQGPPMSGEDLLTLFRCLA